MKASDQLRPPTQETRSLMTPAARDTGVDLVAATAGSATRGPVESGR